MGAIAVIDTETNWENQVMSLGAVLSDDRTWKPAEGRYYLFSPQWQVGGMYDGVLDLVPREKTRQGSREDCLRDLQHWLKQHGVEALYAYNARFDCTHLQELQAFPWYDIMGLAAYRQHNWSIPQDLPCCSTGRLKRCYGVEPTLRRLSGEAGYRETHNALFDARDELRILELLRKPASAYEICRIPESGILPCK